MTAISYSQRIANNDQEFIPRLKNHLLAHYDDISFDRVDPIFSDEEQDSIKFVGNCIYMHQVFCINYTTYNLRHAQDSINIRNHPYVMTLGHEDEDDGTKSHLYWYAKVLGIFYVNVRHSGHMETKHMDFLWVHWFGHDLDHKGGFSTCQLHCIGLTDSKDFTSYRFLNPSDVL